MTTQFLLCGYAITGTYVQRLLHPSVMHVYAYTRVQVQNQLLYHGMRLLGYVLGCAPSCAHGYL